MARGDFADLISSKRPPQNRHAAEPGVLASPSDYHVYSKIKALLIRFAFFPGDKIRIPELSDQLRVSATPVREALHRLYAERLLGLAPRRGFVARDLDAEELENLFALLMLLLRHVIEECAARRKLGAIARALIMDSTAESLESSIIAIVSHSRNQEIQRITRNALDRTHFIRRMQFEVDAIRVETTQKIADLRAALMVNNIDATRRALDAWLAADLSCLPQLLKEGLDCLYREAHPSRSTRGAPT